MMEGVQGEGGVTPATPEYLLGLRALCDQKNFFCSWTASSPDIIAPDGSKVFNGFWKWHRHLACAVLAGLRNLILNHTGKMPVPLIFCPTAFRWPNRLVADSPSARSGCARRMPICWGRARTLNIWRHAARLRRRAQGARSHRTRTAGRTGPQTRRMVRTGIGTARNKVSAGCQTRARLGFHLGLGTGRKGKNSSVCQKR